MRPSPKFASEQYGAKLAFALASYQQRLYSLWPLSFSPDTTKWLGSWLTSLLFCCSAKDVADSWRQLLHRSPSLVQPAQASAMLPTVR
jgi:hypothetical protein